MEQSLKILQMDNLELEEYVRQVSEENPLIDFSDDQDAQQKKDLLRRKLELISAEDHRCVIGYDSYYEEDEIDPLERLRPPEQGMRELLMDQIRMLDISREDAHAAGYIVECLDNNGYLSFAPSDMAAHTGWQPEQIQKAIHIVQGLEPAGVGASSLSECLLLQLERRGLLSGLMRKIVHDYLPQLGQGRFNQIAAHLGESPDTIKRCYRLIRELNPKPCASLGGERSVRYIIPDIAVVKFKDHFEVVLNDLVSARIVVRRDYLSLLEGSPDQEALKYVANRLSQAEWVVDAIKRRNSTLLSVGQSIVKRQLPFFRMGSKYLHPMTLSEVAQEVGLHPSTISRIANSCYLQCPYGVFPVRFFFSQGTENASGESLSSTSIKEILQDLIASEDPCRPWSDQDLVQLLQKEGAAISRRTVAKYREQLGIGSSCVRKAQR